MKKAVMLSVIVFLLFGCEQTESKKDDMYSSDQCTDQVDVYDGRNDMYSDVQFKEGVLPNKEWDDVEFPVNIIPIKTKEDAIKLAEIVFESLNKENRCINYKLTSIFHDVEDNFWKLVYSENRGEGWLVPSLHMVIDGNNCEIIKMWVEEG
jgi:hypothetical protein